MRAVLAALLLLGLLTGCASTATETDAARGQSIAATQQATAPPVDGLTVTIDKLGVEDAPVVPLGLNADRTLQVPSLDRVDELGVYTGGPAPGDIGPAILLGHINGNGKPGVFAQLSTLAVGDTVTVQRPDGTVRFEVYRTVAYPKARFNSREVYSDTTGAELRLISCDGALDATGHNYLDNRVVFLRKV